MPRLLAVPLLLAFVAACSDGAGTRDNNVESVATPRATATEPSPSPPTPAPGGAGEEDAPLPEPREAIPRRPRSLARTIVAVERSLTKDIEQWREAGTRMDHPAIRRIRLRALYEQRITRRLVRDGALWRRVAPRLPRGIRTFYSANVDAGRGVRAITRPLDEVPRFRFARPEAPRRLMRHYKRAQRRYRVPWDLLAAVNFTESKFGRVLGPSTAGALGPMQFLPSTWDAYGDEGDILDPRDSIMAAARYLNASGAPRRMRAALYAYNPSYAYVDAIRAYARQIRRNANHVYRYYFWQVFVATTDGVVQVTGPGSPRPAF